MGCPKLEYNLSAEPRLRCVYNAADGENHRVIHPTTDYPPVAEPAIWQVYTAESEQPRLYVPEYRLYIVCGETDLGVYRYSYCLNNPLIYTDPSGEFIFTILAGIFCPPLAPFAMGIDYGWMTGGMKGMMTEGMTFWDGAWRGGLVGAVGSGLAMVGGGTFLANVAWGMGQGAVTGGLNAALWGNDIGKGMLYGAAIGGAFAAATSGIEACGNYQDGHGFRTNEGVIKHYLKDGQYQNAIDYVQVKYGMTLDYRGNNVSMKYNSNLSAYGETDPYTGNIEIGPAGIRSSSELKATMVHEYGHSVRDRVLDAGGNFVQWQYPTGSFSSTNQTLVTDGPLGYANEIYNAGKLHIKPKFLAPQYNPLWSEWNKSWFYLTPNRFTNPVNLLWY